MNVLLQFKRKSHSEAYSYDLQVQVTKRLIIVLIWVIINVGVLVVNLGVNKTISMTPFDYTKMAIVFVVLLGLCILRCNLERTKKYQGKINLLLDICIIWAQFELFPFVNKNALEAFSKLGIFTVSWCVCIGNYSTYFAIANWWIKAIVPILQIIYFLVPTVEQEPLWSSIVIVAFECMIPYVSYMYVYERYSRKDFLEKRKVYENYEAIMRIFDDIKPLMTGVMIVDPRFNLIYSNRTIELMFKQPKDTCSLEALFSRIQVKSITPILETFITERIQSSHEYEDSECQNTLKDYMDIISKVLFLPNSPEASVTAETLWWDSTSSQHRHQKKNYSIKFTTSLFMSKTVIVVNVTDTTDRDSLIAAQASSDYKTRLLSSVSHELRTPLNGSINFIEESLTDATIPSITKDKWLIPALRSNRLLLSLVNDILDFSQMHAGKLRLVFEPRSIVETAKECIELLEIQASKKKLKLSLQNNIPPEKEILLTDHNRLRQVMLNLLSNAVKFTFKGEVALILDPLPGRNQNESTFTRKGVRVTCRDTGIGISEEDQKKLFQAFEKIDLGNRSPINATGAGLGLLISNNLVQRLSPAEVTAKESKIIQLESKIDQGTSFYFEVYDHEDKKSNIQQFDLEQSSKGESHGICSEKGLDLRTIEELSRPISFSTAYRSSARGLLGRDSKSQDVIQTINLLGSQMSLPSIICKCPKVLLVDDDPFNLTALEQILSRLHITCHWAFNGKEAIERIETRQHNRCSPACQQYKIIFLDCNMPILDGYETSKILRQMVKRGEIDDLKIIACTAFVQQSDEDNAKQAGMDDFCTKPIKLEGIREKLRTVGFFDRSY